MQLRHLEKEELIRSGSHYHVPAGRYHETMVHPGTLAVTAALTKTIGGRSQVLGDLTVATPLRYARSRLEEVMMEHTVQQVLTHLSQAPVSPNSHRALLAEPR